MRVESLLPISRSWISPDVPLALAFPSDPADDALSSGTRFVLCRRRSDEQQISVSGDTLTVSIWADGNEAVFRTTTDDGSGVLDGRCTFA